MRNAKVKTKVHFLNEQKVNVTHTCRLEYYVIVISHAVLFYKKLDS